MKTIEEKAKAYDEALKEAVIAHKDEDRHLKATLERIFPELKENEDERIGKEIIDYFEHYPNIIVKRERRNDWIAWLEKQGEKGTNGNEREIPNSAWSEEDEQYVMDALNLFSFGCSFHGVGKVKDWLKSLKDRVGNFDDGYKVGFSAAKHNQWKPSEEQMVALEKECIAHSNYELCRLLEQLKKLMEE